MSNSQNQKPAPHVALLPSSGMGHLTPFLRFAVSLAQHGVQITLITTHPTISLAESQTLSHFFSTFPHITPKQLNLLPLNNATCDNSEDPFYVKYEAIRLSSHLLKPLLSSLSPPLSTLVTDMSLASTVIPVTQSLNLPNYILFTSSAQMLTLFVSFHATVGSKAPNNSDKTEDYFQTGLQSIPKSMIPPPLLSDTPNLLRTQIIENGKKMIQSDGILVNTFQTIEQDSLGALNDGKVVNRLPRVTAIGPFPPLGIERTQSVPWLDDQPDGSVLYVSFGSRTAMSREQIRELGDGLERSGCRFLWVVKEKKVDREDGGELGEVVGDGFMERVKERGLVVKNWVNQEEVMSHKAVGGFLSHCGWNSVSEAMWNGVPILAWPQHGDQKMNAFVVERIGMGLWAEAWGWGGGEVVVKGEEIAEKVKDIMGNELVKVKAKCVGEEARRAVGDGGGSKKGLMEVIEIWKKSF